MQATQFALNASNSFALPDICIRIRKMLDDDSTSIDEIADLVAMDPSMSSKLLKLANSPLFRFRSQVDSITKAINIIGGEALYNLVMAETARNAFDHFANQNFDLKGFWKQSIYSALIAKHLARLCRVRGSDRFFLLGLLQNLGELVVASQEANLADKCLQFDKSVAPWTLQKQVLGFAFSDCSAEVLRLWQLPPQLYFPIDSLHDEDKALTNKEIAILFTSVRAATALTNENLYSVDALVNPVILSSAGLNEEDLHDAIHFSTREADKMLAVMGQGGN